MKTAADFFHEDPFCNMQDRLEPLMAPGVWLSLCIAAWEETRELDMLRTDDGRDESVARESDHIRRLKHDVRRQFHYDELPAVPGGDLLTLLSDAMRIVKIQAHTPAVGQVFLEIEKARNALDVAQKR